MGIYKQKNSDNWYIDYYLPGGKRIREVAGTSRKLAEQLLGKRKAQILEGKFNVERPDAITFEEILKKYFDYASTSIKPTTFRRYKVSANQLKPFFDGRFIHQISAYDFERYKQARIKTATPATVNRDLAFLRRVFNQARRWNLITKTPMADLDFYREDNIRTRFFSEDELKRLLAACRLHPYLFLGVSIALHTGMRRGEVLSLRIPGPGEEPDKMNWIDLENRYFHLNITKTSKHRKVPINDALYPIVREAVELLEESKEGLGGKRLFKVKDFRRAFDGALKRAGIESGIFHDLRRTFISYAMMAGYSQEVIQRVVGQEDPSIFKRYAHLAPDLQKQVVQKVGQIFGNMWEERQGQEAKEELE
jgi:integrase